MKNEKITVEQARKQIMRPVELMATELKNNYFAKQEWDKDPRIYCMTHCHVYKNIDLYINDVNSMYEDM